MPPCISVDIAVATVAAALPSSVAAAARAAAAADASLPICCCACGRRKAGGRCGGLDPSLLPLTAPGICGDARAQLMPVPASPPGPESKKRLPPPPPALAAEGGCGSGVASSRRPGDPAPAMPACMTLSVMGGPLPMLRLVLRLVPMVRSVAASPYGSLVLPNRSLPLPLPLTCATATKAGGSRWPDRASDCASVGWPNGDSSIAGQPPAPAPAPAGTGGWPAGSLAAPEASGDGTTAGGANGPSPYSSAASESPSASAPSSASKSWALPPWSPRSRAGSLPLPAPDAKAPEPAAPAGAGISAIVAPLAREAAVVSHARASAGEPGTPSSLPSLPAGGDA